MKQQIIRKRSRRGSMIVLVGAIILGIVLAILFFALNYMRMLGAHNQQRTAIEAAALAAAEDLTNLVVDDPNYGLVSLSDVAPTRSATKAGDNYATPVQGINTILATVRLDMIIASQFNDPIMKDLANRDYDNAMAAKDLLQAALNAAVAGGSGYDADGRVMDPMKDALDKYNENAVRMMGVNKCTLVPNSLKLSLGCITNEPTSTPIPKPTQFAQMSASQQQNGFYLPYVNVPYNGKDFVFVATSNDVHLVDHKNVKPTVGGLPYQMPTVVICEADELYRHSDNYGKESQNVIHAKACAEPACMMDNLPAPGALQLTFSNGRPSQITNLESFLTLGDLNNSPTDYIMTPQTNDSPPETMVPLVIVPNAGDHPNFGAIIRVAFYDWIRRARTKPDLQQLASTFPQAIQENVPTDSPHAVFFEFTPVGGISQRCQAVDPGLYGTVSQKQYFAATGLALHDTPPNINVPKTSYDFFIKDYCYAMGRTKGGKHAGEPFGTGGATVPPAPMFSGGGWINEGVTNVLEFQVGSAAGAIRPTYEQPGTAVEFITRVRSR